MPRVMYVFFVLAVGQIVIAQQLTLKERIAQAQTDISVMHNVDGPPLVFARVLEQTDLVVRGVIGQEVGHLSDDGRDVYTTYELIKPRVVFQAKVVRSPQPGILPGPITVTQPGGTVRIDGHSATVVYDDIAKLTPGMDVVVLLREDHDKHWVAGRYGVFEVRDSRVVPLVRRPGEHLRFEGLTADRFLTEVVAIRERLAVK